MWYAMREWISNGGKIPSLHELITEISAPLYSFNATGKIQLEEKKLIKERIGKSPDLADALALTFAMPIMPEFGRRQQYADIRPYAFGPQGVFGDHFNDCGDDYYYNYGTRCYQPRQKYADGVLPSLIDGIYRLKYRCGREWGRGD